MPNFKIKETRERTMEAGKKLESMKAQMETLKQQKAKLLEARTELEGSGIDEASKEQIREAISAKIEQTEKQAETLSDEISEQTKILEDSMQETQEAETETINEKSSIETKMAFLESLGLQNVLEGVKARLEADLQNIEALRTQIVEMRRIGEDAQRIASSLK